MPGVSEAAPRRSGSQLFDEIGPWSVVKLDLVQRYAAQYSTILSRQRNPELRHVYVDAFAGGGVHVSKKTRELVPGSPMNALWLDPPFQEYHFIELSQVKVGLLHEIAGKQSNVHIHAGDCNEILTKDVFPRVRYEDFTRGLCLLDPYGLHLDWHVLKAAGSMRSLEIFLNFPIMHINRNVLRRDYSKVDPGEEAKMTRFWGDESWRDVVRKPSATLFGDVDEKVSNQELAEAFRKRLRNVAGFAHVPSPCAMKNSKGAVVYYLYFMAQRPVAADIVRWIFDHYGRL
ncbi:MAG: three-Cys-motif partner protein TcmP [Acidobacteriota bacterium]